jgi:S1-C subfamily serine protease
MHCSKAQRPAVQAPAAAGSRAARRAVALGAMLLALAAAPLAAAPGAGGRNGSGPAADAGPPPSTAAQRMWEQSKGQLVQIRILPKGQSSQTSAGSGFLVGADGLAITNYHVMAQVALRPEKFRAAYQATDGRQGEVELLGFDAVADLALVRLLAFKSDRHFEFRSAERPLSRGEKVFSLGNPLDIGFAVIEGTYNGLVERSFYPQLFFSGAINPGMSGGPALDADGRVVGINVAKRIDGEQASFLVPAERAQALLARSGPRARPIDKPVYPELTAQLLEHQQRMTERFLAQGFRQQLGMGYSIPLPPESFMRCWGSGGRTDGKALEIARTDCRMDTRVFTGDGSTGALSLRHESYDGSKLGLVRFTAMYRESFENERFGASRQRYTTAPRCHERFVRNAAGLPLRAVLCLNAYKRLKGLYDASMLLTSLDRDTAGVQGRLDAHGVSFDNALRLAQAYLDGFARAPEPAAPAATRPAASAPQASPPAPATPSASAPPAAPRRAPQR